MNPSKASGFITIYQGNPPVAVADFRPLSVKNTVLGQVVQKHADALNEELKSLYSEGAHGTGLEPAAAAPVVDPNASAPAPEGGAGGSESAPAGPVGNPGPEGVAGPAGDPAPEAPAPEAPAPEAPAAETQSPDPAASND